MTWLEVLPRLPTAPPGNKLIWNSACLHKRKEFKDCAGRKRVLTYYRAQTQRKVAWVTKRPTDADTHKESVLPKKNCTSTSLKNIKWW